MVKSAINAKLKFQKSADVAVLCYKMTDLCQNALSLKLTAIGRSAKFFALDHWLAGSGAARDFLQCKYELKVYEMPEKRRKTL